MSNLKGFSACAEIVVPFKPISRTWITMPPLRHRCYSSLADRSTMLPSLNRPTSHLDTVWTSRPNFWGNLMCVRFAFSQNAVEIRCDSFFCIFPQTNLPIFKLKESSVRRRYSDFEWLRAELERESKVRFEFDPRTPHCNSSKIINSTNANCQCS